MRQSICQILTFFQKIPPHEQNPKHVQFKPEKAKACIDQVGIHVLSKDHCKHPQSISTQVKACCDHVPIS